MEDSEPHWVCSQEVNNSEYYISTTLAPKPDSSAQGQTKWCCKRATETSFFCRAAPRRRATGN